MRVVVITGAGDRAFVSGADISEFGDRRTTPEARAEYDRGRRGVGAAWAGLEKPIIAMIRGYCIGGGLLTALQADIRIAADDSQFGVPAARLGLGYGYGGVAALMALVGPAFAAEILFSARRLSAAEALQCGLVNRVVPVADLEDAVDEPRPVDPAERAAHRRRCKARSARRAGRPTPRPRPRRQDGRGVLPLRGLPRRPAGLRREAPSQLHG